MKYYNLSTKTAKDQKPEVENIFYMIFDITLTDLTLSCPGSLLKTTPPPPGYPWISGGRYDTPEPRFGSLVLDH